MSLTKLAADIDKVLTENSTEPSSVFFGKISRYESERRQLLEKYPTTINMKFVPQFLASEYSKQGSSEEVKESASGQSLSFNE